MSDAPQGSAEWRQARLGKATASRIADIVARTRSGWSTSRENYLADLVVERLTGAPLETYKSAAMIRGTETEAEARLAFELQTGWEVEEVGFIDHPTIPWSGASPDGLIVGNAMLEIKCPEVKTHLNYLLGEPIGRAYECQAQWAMEVTSASTCYWCSYHPLFPPEMRLVIRHIMRGGEELAELRREVPIFLREVEEKLDLITRRFHGPTVEDMLRASIAAGERVVTP